MTIENNGRVNILGLPVDRLSLSQTIEKIEDFIASRKPHRLVVVNAAKIVKARKDAALKHIIETADLIGPDGVPVVWLSRLLGRKLPGRVNGTDLMEKLFEVAAQKHYRIFFFGATEEVIQNTVKIAQEKYHGLQVAGFRNGYFSAEEEPEIIRTIRRSKADILFVGFGSPKKEFWIAKHLKDLNVPIVHGVGGSFDVVAGKTKRAPVWMQNFGLEWFYRLLQEPGRMWKRYLITNSIFVWLSLREILLRYRFALESRGSVMAREQV